MINTNPKTTAAPTPAQAAAPGRTYSYIITFRLVDGTEIIWRITSDLGEHVFHRRVFGQMTDAVLEQNRMLTREAIAQEQAGYEIVMLDKVSHVKIDRTR